MYCLRYSIIFFLFSRQIFCLNWNQQIYESTVNKNISKIELALKKGANINEADEYGYTPLMLASLHGNKDVVELLLKHGANMYRTSKYDVTAFQNAIKRGHTDIVKLFLEHGMDVNFTNQEKKTFLMIAIEDAEKEKKEIIHLLLTYGARVNDRNNDGSSALFYAVWYGYIDLAELLLQNGANINVANKYGSKVSDNISLSPHLSDPSKQEEMINLLKKYGANIHLTAPKATQQSNG